MDIFAPNDRLRRREWVRLTVLLAVAFGLRLGAVAAGPGLTAPPRFGSDEYEYDLCAWNLVRGNGYVGVSPDVVDATGRPREHVTAYRPPVATLFFASVYVVAGHNYAAAHMADTALATFTVLLVFAIAGRLFGRGAAWLAAVVYAFYPLAIYYNLTLLSESQGAFLVCLFVWLCLPIAGPRGLRWAGGAGVALGLLLLCKPGFVFLMPLLGIWALAVCGRSRALWLRAAVIPACAGLAILPWAVRNHQEFGGVIPFSTGGGSLLLQANNRLVVADPKYHGYAVWDTSLPEYAAALRAPNDEIARDAVAKQFAIAWLKENPDKWFYLARGKVWRLWTPSYFGGQNRAAARIASVYYGTILLAFGLAVLPVTAWLVRRRDPGLIVLCPIVATVAMAIVFHGQHRYRFPIDSLCMVVAAGGVMGLVRAVAEGKLRARVRALVASRRIQVGLVAAAGLGIAWVAACRWDDERIQAFRADLARQRVAALETAVEAYRAKYGRLPDPLETLVPDFLPTLEALHAPGTSLEYFEYRRLATADATRVPGVVCYEIVAEPQATPPFRIRQTKGLPPDPVGGRP